MNQEDGEEGEENEAADDEPERGQPKDEGPDSKAKEILASEAKTTI